jgi:hypothetical protein
MTSVTEVLYLRRPRLEYVSPPICEFDFSSSGGPIISLEALGQLLAPSGFVLGGRGRFRLSWSNYPGAICYTVYKAVDSNNPFGAYVIVAECIEDPEIDLEPEGPGCYRVSAITPHGETQLSEPICGVGSCPFILSGATPPSQLVTAGDAAAISCLIGNPDTATSYRWFKDGMLYLDTTATTQETLSFPSVALSDAGSYALVVSNVECDDTSSPSILQVSPSGGSDPIAYWKMDGLADPQLDEVNGTPLTFQFNVVGTPGDPGKINEAFRYDSNNNQSCVYQTALLSSLKATGAGAELLFWLQFNNVVTPPSTVCDISISQIFLTDIDAAGLVMTYDPLNDPGFLTISFDTALIHTPFTHTIGGFHFFRVRYDATSGKVGFSFDNGALIESAGTRFLLGTPISGLVGVSTRAGPGTRLNVNLDEFGVFGNSLSDPEADSWWNGGAGRTYP